MSIAQTEVQSLLGNFLSTYDETALIGVVKLIELAKSESSRHIVNCFLEDAAAVDAFVALLSRSKCAPARIFDACTELLKIAKKPARVLLLRLLCATTPRQRIRSAIATLSDVTLDAAVSALHLLAAMVEANSKQTMAKFGRQVPLKASSFTDALTFAQLSVRPARVRLIVAILTARHSEVSASAATQSGVLTKLADDLVELAKKEQHVPLISAAVAAVASALVNNDAIPTDEKRRVLVSQRGALKSLVALLAKSHVADSVASLLRRIVTEVSEASRDYALARDTEDTRMPNFALLLLLRHLRPKHRVLDSHLVVYILHQCPDLYRPYLLRVSKHLPEPDAALSAARTSVAVCNLLARLFLCPLASHLTTHSATLLDPSATATTFYELTPEAAADEVLPEWFAEAAYRTASNGGSPLHMVFILQCAQAAINRAAAVKRCVKELFAERRRQQQLATVTGTRTASGEQLHHPIDFLVQGQHAAAHGTDIDEDAYMSRLDAILQDRFLRREAFQPLFHQHAVAASNPTTPSDGVGAETKHQFIMQRAFLYLNAASTVFNWRTPWSAVVAAPSQPWSPSKQVVRCVRDYSCTSIRTLCMLLLNNLARQVKLPKLTHIAFGAGSQQQPTAAAAAAGSPAGKKSHHGNANNENDHAKPPLLLDLLYWAIAAQQSSAVDFPTMRSLAALLRSTVQATVTGSVITDGEAALWLRFMTPDDATLLIHTINYVAQLNEKHQSEIVDSAESECGFFVAAGKMFINRQREKAAANPSVWQAHTAAYLDTFAKVLTKMAKRWPTRDTVASELLFGDRPAQSDGAASNGDDAQPTTTDARSATAEVRTRLLRNAAADAGIVDEHTTLVRLFTHRMLPALVAERAPSEHPEAWAACCATGESTVEQVRALDARPWCTSISGPWLMARLLLSVPATTATARSEVEAVARTIANCPWRSEGATVKWDAYRLLGFALVCFAVCRGIALWGAPANDTIVVKLRELMLLEYSGTVSATDRVLFAALALVEGGGAAPEQVTSSSASDSGSAGAPEGADSDDDEGAHPVVRNSAVLGGAVAKKHRAEQQRSDSPVPPATAAASTKSAASSSSSSSSTGLKALREARFLVGGATALPTATPEVEVLTTIVEGLTDREIAKIALRMPLRICSPSPAVARRHPLQLVFPDAMDGNQEERGMRWYRSLPAPNGAIDPYECDPVSSLVYDPRYLLPLYYVVASLRFKHVVPVPATTVTRLIPVAIRALSALDGSLRTLGLNCLALLYRSIHPIPRLAVNALRLQVQQRASADGAPPRLLAVHTAHAVMAFGPISNPSNALHAACTASLSLDDDLAVPLEDLLTEFPSSAVIGLPVVDRPGEVMTTPQLRHVLEQLRHSCCVWPDYAFISRRHALQKLCFTAGFLIANAEIRPNLLRTIEAITLSHCTNANAAHDVVVPWCLETLNALCNTHDVRAFEIPATEVLALLRRVYATYRPVAIAHRRAATELVRTLRFALSSKVLSRDLLFDSLQVIAAAWHAGGPHGLVLATGDERQFCVEMMVALRDSGVVLNATSSVLMRFAKELRV